MSAEPLGEAPVEPDDGPPPLNRGVTGVALGVLAVLAALVFWPSHGLDTLDRPEQSLERVVGRDMDQNQDFAAWYWEHLEEELDAEGASDKVDQHYLMLSNEIGDWVGGLRYSLRGGVARLVDVMVLPGERHQGYAHRLLAAFEERAIEGGALLAEFWTDDLRAEGLLAALGWQCIFRRENYIGGKNWALMEKRLEGSRR